jgi:hypothetical protein
LVCGFVIKLHRQLMQEVAEALTTFRIEAAASFGHRQSVQNFQRPEQWRNGPRLRKLVKQGGGCRGAFILETPTERH